MLLSILDVTDQRALELQKQRLSSQKDLLLKEMRHRIANSLQLIASILLIKAGIVESEDTRRHLKDTHERIMSIATVQRQLNPSALGERIPVAKYLSDLCGSLARSMVGGRRPIAVSVKAEKGDVSSEVAISLGLITTELVINAIKHAFPSNRKGEIQVVFKDSKREWSLEVLDNGTGRLNHKDGDKGGLGTSIVVALSDQLNAKIKTKSTPSGTSVSFIHKYTDPKSGGRYSKS